VISEPFFLDTPSGRLFAVHHRPADAARTRGQVLCAPPFNEEMNRCRSVMTLQAQAFAKIGFGTLVLDLLGTGDSEGQFVDARWPLWLNNLSAGKVWLDAQAGGCSVIWGIRLGAILAACVHGAAADPRVALVLWQPVTDGKSHLTQFLRVRIAANMDRADVARETTASMRETLTNGQPVEVAGYEIHPELAAAIDAARLTQHTLAPGTHMLWLENASAQATELAPASGLVLARWPGQQVLAAGQVFSGPAFWQLHERVVAPSAIEQTTAWLDALAVSK
jgi:exosortase A-associated hydrolase 2